MQIIGHLIIKAKTEPHLELVRTYQKNSPPKVGKRANEALT